MSSSTQTAAPPWTTRNRVGLVLAGLYGLGNIPSVAASTPEGVGGPGLQSLVVDSVLPRWSPSSWRGCVGAGRQPGWRPAPWSSSPSRLFRASSWTSRHR